MKKRVEDAINATMEKVKSSDIGGILDDARAKIEEISKNPSKHIGEILAQAKLLYDMLKCAFNGECAFPWKTVAAIAAVLIYFVDPLDLIPDFIPGIGYIDDVAAFAIAFKLIRDDLKEYAIKKGIDLKEYGLQ